MNLIINNFPFQGKPMKNIQYTHAKRKTGKQQQQQVQQ